MDVIDVEQIKLKMMDAAARGQEPAFLFDRVSHEKQRDGISLDQQEETGLAYADRKGLYVVHSFVIVESAYKENRKYFQKTLDIAEQLRIKHLIFKNHERMSRNVSHLDRIKTMWEKGVNFHFYESSQIVNVDSNYDEKWMFYFFVLMAQRHSLKLSHDVKNTYKFKASQGVSHQRPPYGYKLISGTKIPVQDKDQVEVVREVFSLYDEQGMSLQQITDLLNARACPSATGRPWNKSIIHHMLKNKFYAGVITLKDVEYPGKHEPVISLEAYQARMDRMTRTHGQSNRKEFTFSRILRCQDCGAILYGDIKKEKHVYYVHKCKAAGRMISYTEGQISEMITAEIDRLTLSEEFSEGLKDAFKTSIKMKSNDTTSARRALLAKLSGIEAKQKKLIDLYADEKIPADLLQKSIEDLQKQKEHIQKQALSLDVDENKFIFTVAGIIDTLRQLPRAYKIASDSDKRAILSKISEGVAVTPSGAELRLCEPYNLILNKELLTLRDTGVRVCASVLPQSNETRTYIESATDMMLLWLVISGNLRTK